MPVMDGIDALSIDLDDTLWPIMPVIEQAERRLHHWFETHCPRVTRTHTTQRLESLRAEVAAAHPERAHDYAFLRRSVIEGLLKESGYASELAEVAYQVFFAARNEVQLFDDVLPALRWLSGRYRLLAVTNGNADIGKIGLGRYFHATVRAADVGAPKPDARLFAEVVTVAGVPAERILHIGDAPYEDIAGANWAGMRSAWINRSGQPWPAQYPPPHSQIEAFGDLVELLSG